MTALRTFLGDASSLVLSLILAVMVWLVAVQSAEPMMERTAPPEPLPIQYVGVPDGQAVFGASVDTARVTLRGVEADLAAVNPASIRVMADLSDLDEEAEGAVKVPLVAECSDCGRKAVRIISITPSAVSVRVGPAKSAQWPVEAQLSDAALQVCRGIQASFDPPTVTISGAAIRVDRVARAIARVQAGASERHLDRSGLAVEAVDVRGEPVDDVTIAPATVALTADLVEVEGCAEAYVSPFYSDPPDGYYVADINVAPDRVELRGPADQLAQFRDDPVVLTQRVDLSEARAPVTTLVPLDLPSGVTTAHNLDGVTVTIRVIPVPGTRTVELPVEPINVPPGLQVEAINAPRVQFLLGGAQADLAGLDAANLRATLDLAGLGEGASRVTPRVQVPPGVVVRSTTPAEVEVRLTAATPAPPDG